MIGQTLSHYRILERLGSGSFGEVYVAEDLRLRRHVALKILKADCLADESRVRRFEQEAQAASALSHPNILTVFDFGNDGGNGGEPNRSTYFIAVERVEGKTLRDCRQAKGWELDEAIDVGLQIAAGLAAAHQAGIVHCDIKPENLMVRPDGLVKILDFGIARLTRDRCSDRETFAPVSPPAVVAPANSLTTPGTITGTTSYMAPEQVQGRDLDARADLFSLGVVLYEMIAGRRPFAADSVAGVCAAILHQEPSPLSAWRDDIPLALEAILRKALEKDREERYPSAELLIADLQQLRSNLQAAVKSDGARFRPSRTDVASAGDSSGVFITLKKVAAFVAAYRQGVMARHSRPRQRIEGIALAKGAAFRGLLPFQEADHQRFYGREMETLALSEMVAHQAFRFGVLYGESGAGKTSLVKAALVPKLWEEGYAPIYCRSYKDPLAAILEECHRRSRLTYQDSETGKSYLRRVATEMGGSLVIICDQFEEFFINFKTAAERATFVRFVAECHNDAQLPVKFLFSMRADFLYLINAEFAAHINEPLMTAKLFRLRNFDERRAAEIIDKSARHAGLGLTAALVKQVARDLSESGVVLPSELQITGEQLQNKHIFTVPQYRRAGGKEALVHSFLEDVMQTSGDRQGAQLLLRCLISEDNTRLTLPSDEIAKRLQRGQPAVDQLLQLFVQARLVREIQEDEPWRYELMHEYLIDKINQVTGKVMDATQRANRFLRQYLSTYAVDKKTRIPIGKLFFIRRYADLASGERARELITRSWRRGFVRAAAFLLFFATVIIGATAAFSVREEWEGRRLRDGHERTVRKAVFSPDGRLLVTCGSDARVIVWDFARRERLATLTEHTNEVAAAAFSPDGKWLATGSADQTAIVWSAASFAKVTTLRAHSFSVSSLAFSSDSRFLVTSSGVPNPLTVLWRAGDWQKMRELPFGLTGDTLLVSGRGQVLLCEPDRTRQIWDAVTGQPLARTIEPEWIGNAAAHSPISSLVMSTNADGTIQFFDLATQQLQAQPGGHKFFSRAVAFSPDGRFAATGAEDIALWDVASRSVQTRFEHTDNVWGLAFSPDGRWLVSTHGDGAILLWDVMTRRRVANFNEHSGAVYSVDFSADGKRLVSTGEDSSVIVWDLASSQKEATLVGHPRILKAAMFTPDGESVISTDLITDTLVWDVASRRQTRHFRSTPSAAGLVDLPSLAPDGQSIAIGEGVFRVTDGDILVTYETLGLDRNSLSAAALSPDGRWLACAGWAGKVVLIDTQTWQVVAEAEAQGERLARLQFSADSRYIVSGSFDGAVLLWSVSPLRFLAPLGSHSTHVQAVAFSPDGERVVSSSDDQTIALWDVSGRRLITRIGTHTAPVISVAFSPDGRTIASGGQDKSVRLYTRHRTLWGYRLD